jgi:hypothetical protein
MLRPVVDESEIFRPQLAQFLAPAGNKHCTPCCRAAQCSRYWTVRFASPDVVHTHARTHTHVHARTHARTHPLTDSRMRGRACVCTSTDAGRTFRSWHHQFGELASYCTKLEEAHAQLILNVELIPHPAATMLEYSSRALLSML